jgi:hypothetical protein
MRQNSRESEELDVCYSHHGADIFYFPPIWFAYKITMKKNGTVKYNNQIFSNYL